MKNEGDIKLVVRIVLLFCICTLVHDFKLPDIIDTSFKNNRFFQFVIIFIFSTGYMITTPTHNFSWRDFISAFIASVIILLLTSPREKKSETNL
ncbi:MAG: hypothetical protein CMM25_05965 [Rhodospirillaceae bacterium]|nr:hypothetical protein [Rhodospirillaceae bacterium]